MFSLFVKHRESFYLFGLLGLIFSLVGVFLVNFIPLIFFQVFNIETIESRQQTYDLLLPWLDLSVILLSVIFLASVGFIIFHTVYEYRLHSKEVQELKAKHL